MPAAFGFDWYLTGDRGMNELTEEDAVFAFAKGRMASIAGTRGTLYIAMGV